MTDLTPENNYQFPPTPAKAMLGRDAWNAVMGSLSARIRELEAQRTDLEDLMADLSYNAQTRVDEAISPLIAEVEGRIDAVNLQLDELQETVDSILAGGIPAENVTESAERRFWTPADAVALNAKADAEAVIASLGLKANSASPTFTGSLTLPNGQIVAEGGGLLGAVTREARSANTVLTGGDQGKLIDCSGAFTQTFAAAAALGDGWWCYVRNSGSGVVTLDPNGSETIDGLFMLPVYPGQAYLLLCSGSNFTTMLVSGDKYLFVTHEVAANTAGPATYTAWTTRPLNTVKAMTIAGASLSGNEITLPAGEYDLDGSFCLRGPATSRFRLQNVTTDVSLVHGNTLNHPYESSEWLGIKGRFTLAATSVVRVEHRSHQAAPGPQATDLSAPEVYGHLAIRKVP